MVMAQLWGALARPTLIQRRCAICGFVCPPSSGTKPLRYCSERCADRGEQDRRNQRRAAARAEGRQPE